MRWAALLPGLVLAGAASAAPPELGLPIACELGRNCWVQQYFDHDPSSGVADYTCGTETYDGHDGTDIRVLDTAATAAVVASAPGTVKAVRDGMADRLVRSDADRAAIADRECGNGVVIDHEDGWQTQYCHMREGSIAVKPGDAVEREARLGDVGYSGMAAFPHVHLTVRHQGKSLDPFDDGPDCAATGKSLWSAPARTALAYVGGAALRSGFAAGPVELAAVETGSLPPESPGPTWPAMVAYVWAINLAAGDKITVTFAGPDGIAASNSETLERSKAQYLLFAGKKQPPGGWPSGDYAGRFSVNRNGAEILSDSWHASIE